MATPEGIWQQPNLDCMAVVAAERSATTAAGFGMYRDINR
jgi:hypothetical protein